MTVIADRAAQLEDLELHSGSHHDFNQGHCAMEVVSWLADEGFTDAPACASPVIRRYVIALNDRWDHERRQTLKPYLVRMIGTGGDGKDTVRKEIAARFLVERLLGDWLDLANMSEHKATLEGKSGPELRTALWAVRDAAWAKRSAAYDELRAKVRAEVEKRLPAADAATAAADAATAAAAATDADAATAATTATTAAAATAATTTAAATTAADAADAATATAADAGAGGGATVDWWGKPYDAAYRAARKYYEEHPLPVMDAMTELAAKQQPLALELLDALIVA